MGEVFFFFSAYLGENTNLTKNYRSFVAVVFQIKTVIFVGIIFWQLENYGKLE
jgi:hypothetical protein